MALFNEEKPVENINLNDLAGHFSTDPEAYHTDDTSANPTDDDPLLPDFIDKEADIKLVREYLDIYQSLLSAGCAFVVGEYDLSKYSWKGKTLDDIAARGTFLAKWLRETIGEADSDKVLFISMLAMNSGSTVMQALADKKRKNAQQNPKEDETRQ